MEQITNLLAAWCSAKSWASSPNIGLSPHLRKRAQTSLHFFRRLLYSQILETSMLISHCPAEEDRTLSLTAGAPPLEACTGHRRIACYWPRCAAVQLVSGCFPKAPAANLTGRPSADSCEATPADTSSCQNPASQYDTS